MRATTLTALLWAAFASAFALVQAASDSDLFWHLASGDWTLDHGAILDRDIWSFTRTGATYGIGAWLGDVALALTLRGAGWLGIDVLRAALVAVAAFFVARLVLRVQPHAGWAAVPILGTILVSRMVWGDRPQLFTLALFPLVLDVLFAARLEGHRRRLALLPIAFLAWANLHGAFPIGLAAVAAFTVESWIARDASRRPMTAVLIASAALSQLNPSGLGALGRAVSYASSSAAWVVEEGPLDILSGAGLVFAFLLLVALGAAMLRGREGIATRLGALWLWPLLIAPFALLALAIQRDTPYACMVLAPFVAAMAPDALGRPRVGNVLSIPRVAAAATIAVVALTVTVVALGAAPRDPDVSGYPAGALAALRDLHGNVLNEYDWGGYLIRYAPEHPTFIDGRGAALFPSDVLRDFQDAVRLSPDYHDVLARWDIGIALLRPGRPLAGALAEDGWRVVAKSAAWILLARP